jgi:CspA family cold shock protein
MVGHVTAFDDERGLGTITSEGREYPFHCTQIANGTRAIAVSTIVEFEIGPGPLGRWEATAITPAVEVHEFGERER